MKLYAAGLLFAMGGAHGATQTVDCGRLLDVKSGASIVVENGSVKSVGPMARSPGSIDLSAYSCLPGFMMKEGVIYKQP